jgi:hypothetical protein
MRNVLYDISTNSADSSSGKSRTCVNFVKCRTVKDTYPSFNKCNDQLLTLLNSERKSHYVPSVTFKHHE